MKTQANTTEETPLTLPTRVGTMGWGYADWVGAFYSAGVSSRDYLAWYAKAFDAVEIDSTFYGTPREAQVKHWRDITPDNFVFCPKVPRAITHEMRLIHAEAAFAEFIRVMRLLEDKRGPMLLQFPPDFTREELGALEAFLPTLQTLDDPTARFAAEFRHRSLIGPDVSALLAEHRVALVAADYAPMPKRFEATTNFAYLRLIGRHGAYTHHRESQADRASDLERWAEALRDNQPLFERAFVFCNNDYEGYSPLTCNRFKRLLGQPAIERPPEVQGSLF